jgi:probable rRNA maturation factor
VSTEEMADLHGRYLDDPEPTDVLSFTMDEDGLLGDVVICPAVAAAQNPDLAAELRLLLVHGILHLLGYDHDQEEERQAMWKRQERYAGVTP